MDQLLQRRIRGDFDLGMLTDRCGTIQNLASCKLVSIRKKTDEPDGNFNLAVFETVSRDVIVPKPFLIEVEDPAQIPSIMADQMTQDRKILFDSLIFVSDSETRVLGFR